jgi:hypothetical protein
MSPLACAKRKLRGARAQLAAAAPGSEEADEATALLASAQSSVDKVVAAAAAAAADDDDDGAGLLRAAGRARLASFPALARALTPPTPPLPSPGVHVLTGDALHVLQLLNHPAHMGGSNDHNPCEVRPGGGIHVPDRFWIHVKRESTNGIQLCEEDLH